MVASRRAIRKDARLNWQQLTPRIVARRVLTIVRNLNGNRSNFCIRRLAVDDGEAYVDSSEIAIFLQHFSKISSSANYVELFASIRGANGAIN
jgi:hypothetical protein